MRLSPNYFDRLYWFRSRCLLSLVRLTLLSLQARSLATQRLCWSRSRGGVALESSDRVKISSTSEGVYTLRLSALTEDDSAQYTVRAVNDAGQTSCTAQLLVHGTKNRTRTDKSPQLSTTKASSFFARWRSHSAHVNKRSKNVKLDGSK